MPFTPSAKNVMLDALAGATTHASLHTDIPNDSGSNEVTGGTYARQPIGFL